MSWAGLGWAELSTESGEKGRWVGGSVLGARCKAGGLVNRRAVEHVHTHSFDSILWIYTFDRRAGCHILAFYPSAEFAPACICITGHCIAPAAIARIYMCLRLVTFTACKASARGFGASELHLDRNFAGVSRPEWYVWKTCISYLAHHLDYLLHSNSLAGRPISILLYHSSLWGLRCPCAAIPAYLCHLSPALCPSRRSVHHSFRCTLAFPIPRSPLSGRRDQINVYFVANSVFVCKAWPLISFLGTTLYIMRIIVCHLKAIVQALALWNLDCTALVFAAISHGRWAP